MKNVLAVTLSVLLLVSSGDSFSASAPAKIVIAYAAMNARLVPLCDPMRRRAGPSPRPGTLGS